MYRTYAGRQVRKAATGSVLAAVALVAVFFLFSQLDRPGDLVKLNTNAAGVMMHVLVQDEGDPRGVLRLAMPILAWSGAVDDVPSVLTPRSLIAGALRTFHLRFSEPLDLLLSEMPLLGLAAAQVPPDPAASGQAAGEGQPHKPEEDLLSNQTPKLSEHCLVGIYNTHTGETYALTDGMERLDGKRGGVVTVSAALQEELETRYGIRVARSDRINDAVYSASYAESEKVVRDLMVEHPHLKVLLDIHRDAGKSRQDSIVTVNGQQVAPILIIIGSDARAPFPNWRQNYALGKAISDRMDSMYPGLSLGVRVKEGRYNQYLHNGAILLEIGTVANSTEEAVASAHLLAEVLAAYLAEVVSGQD